MCTVKSAGSSESSSAATQFACHVEVKINVVSFETIQSLPERREDSNSILQIGIECPSGSL